MRLRGVLTYGWLILAAVEGGGALLFAFAGLLPSTSRLVTPYGSVGLLTVTVSLPPVASNVRTPLEASRTVWGEGPPAATDSDEGTPLIAPPLVGDGAPFTTLGRSVTLRVKVVAVGYPRGMPQRTGRHRAPSAPSRMLRTLAATGAVLSASLSTPAGAFAANRKPVYASQPLLEIRGLSKSFGGIRAVAGLDLTVMPGHIVAVIGPNGSGKTTFFNLVTGLTRPDAGRVRFAGEDMAGLSPHVIVERGIARTFQNLRLFANMTVTDNVLVGTHARTATGALGAVVRPLAGVETCEFGAGAPMVVQRLRRRGDLVPVEHGLSPVSR